MANVNLKKQNNGDKLEKHRKQVKKSRRKICLERKIQQKIPNAGERREKKKKGKKEKKMNRR